MKKGSMEDLAVILCLIMAAVLVVLICTKVLTVYTAAWPFAGDSATVLAKGVTAMYTFDYMVVFFAFGLAIFSIISAFYIRSHPAFFGISVLLLAVLIFASAQVTNILDKFITTTEFATVANNFPYVVALTRNLPMFTLVVGILIAIVMYGKPSVGGGQE